MKILWTAMACAAALCAVGTAQAGVLTFNDPGVIDIDNNTNVATYTESGFTVSGQAATFLPLDSALVGGFDGTPFSLKNLFGGAFSLLSLDYAFYDLGFAPGLLTVTGPGRRSAGRAGIRPEHVGELQLRCRVGRPHRGHLRRDQRVLARQHPCRSRTRHAGAHRARADGPGLGCAAASRLRLSGRWLRGAAAGRPFCLRSVSAQAAELLGVAGPKRPSGAAGIRLSPRIRP